jgi:hypothetical protein
LCYDDTVGQDNIKKGVAMKVIGLLPLIHNMKRCFIFLPALIFLLIGCGSQTQKINPRTGEVSIDDKGVIIGALPVVDYNAYSETLRKLVSSSRAIEVKVYNNRKDTIQILIQEWSISAAGNTSPIVTGDTPWARCRASFIVPSLFHLLRLPN